MRPGCPRECQLRLHAPTGQGRPIASQSLARGEKQQQGLARRWSTEDSNQTQAESGSTHALPPPTQTEPPLCPTRPQEPTARAAGNPQGRGARLAPPVGTGPWVLARPWPPTCWGPAALEAGDGGQGWGGDSGQGGAQAQPPSTRSSAQKPNRACEPFSPRPQERCLHSSSAACPPHPILTPWYLGKPLSSCWRWWSAKTPGAVLNDEALGQAQLSQLCLLPPHYFTALPLLP